MVKQRFLNRMPIAFLLLGFMNACQPNHSLTEAFFPQARFQVRLVLGSKTEASSLPATTDLGRPASTAARIDTVKVTVLDSASRDIVIRNQVLPIVETPEGRFAEGVLQVPVEPPEQAFILLVQALSAVAQEPSLSGVQNVTLQPGEVGLLVPITQEGRVQVSSVFGQGFGAELGVDGDPTTSWFSAGTQADGNTSTYTWTGQRDDRFILVRITNNSNHSVPQFRTGFGFETVTVQVLNTSGRPTFEQTVPYPQPPTEATVLTPLATGRAIRLLLNGHEDPTCGGLSELFVAALRAP